MTAKLIFPGVYEISLGPVNAWLIEDSNALTLVDTGYSGKTAPIWAALQQLGRKPSDVTQVLLTHCHPDHAGGLAEVLQSTGASAAMHKLDADVVRGHTPMVRSTVSPGLLNSLLYRLFIKNVPGVVPQATVTRELNDGDVLPIGGGLQVIHAPGHSAGHCAFLLQRDGGLLFAGDACGNMPTLGYSIVYDDHALARQTLAALAKLRPAAICFGHGKPLVGAAVAGFARKWA